MAFQPDRLKAAFFALFRSSVPRLDHYTTYRARVVAVSEDGKTVDLFPDDPRIPPMGGVPLRQGLPGIEISMPAIAEGTYLCVGWSGGDPSAPYAAPFWEGGETTLRLSIKAATIQLNGDVVELGGTGLNPITDGLVHGSGIDPFTGVSYAVLGNASRVVRGKKQ